MEHVQGPVYPRSGSPDPAPALQPAACPVSRSRGHAGPAGTRADLSSLVALHHPWYQESSWKSPPRPEQGVRPFQSPVDQPGHRHSARSCALDGLASPPVPQVTEPPSGPHVEPERKDPHTHTPSPSMQERSMLGSDTREDTARRNKTLEPAPPWTGWHKAHLLPPSPHTTAGHNRR